MKTFYIRDKVIIVDDEDFERVVQYRWSLCRGYAYRNTRIGFKKHKVLALHNFILNFTPSVCFEIDHINRNPLDNRKENLRIVSRQLNNFNMPKQNSNTSGYKGVYFNRKRKKWTAQIKVNQVPFSVYYGLSKLEAAYAYNLAAKAIAGDCAYLNDVPEPANAEQIKRYVDKQIKRYAPTTQPN